MNNLMIKFYSGNKILDISVVVIGSIFNILTIGLLFNKTYDLFFEPKNYFNRKILLKNLINNKIELTIGKYFGSENIEIYHFDEYEIWIDKINLNVALVNNGEILIGRFVVSKSSEMDVINIIREIYKNLK